MFLHHDKEVFKEIIVETGNHLGIKSVIIEKDYYVTIALMILNSKFNGIVFRGGTSLSKSYGIVDRFSEDIDISIDASKQEMTEGRKRKLKQAVVDTIHEMGLEVYNLSDTKSRRDYNQYTAKYNSIYSTISSVKSELIFETYVATAPYPYELRKIDNYIFRFLKEMNYLDLALKYDLLPFEMKVQDVSRTYIDKVFALCDYYMNGMFEKHSRHIYDLYQIDMLILFDDEFRQLIKEVRKARSNVSVCLSAKPGVDINKLLREIIESKCYKNDYLERTEKILFTPISYDTAIRQLEKVIESGCFSE